jgi:putative endonuclease
MDYCVYLLYNTNNNCTYIGSTNNIQRRTRQHNGELVGGAKYTKAKKQNGEWLVYGTINDLNKNLALSIEKKIQKKSRKSTGKTTIEKRINAIDCILLNFTDYKFIINTTQIHNSVENILDTLQKI